MIAAIILGCFCGIACALGFSCLVQHYRGRDEGAEGTATVIFGCWVAVSVFIIFLDRVSTFHGHSDLVVVLLLAAATLAATIWITRVLQRPVRR